MSAIKELLTDEHRQALESLKTLASETPVIYTVVDEDEEPTCTINGVVVDLRGDAMHETECVDCRAPIHVDILPKGVKVEQMVGQTREARCEECGKAHLAGKQGVVIHKPRVKKHQPRLTDGIDHPVEVKHTSEESDMDLSKYSPAQLAEHIRTAQDMMRAKLEAEMPANVMAALAGRREAEAADKALMEADRDLRAGHVLRAFTIKGKEVPALDLSEVTDMTTVASAKQRSPYNKVLHALGLDILKPDEATYAALASLHQDWLSERDDDAQVVVSQFDAEAPALEPQVQVLVDFGFDVEQATKMVAAL